MLRPGSNFPSAVADTEQAAIMRAIEIVARAGGGGIVVKSSMGDVVSTGTVDRLGLITPVPDALEDDAL